MVGFYIVFTTLPRIFLNFDKFDNEECELFN